MRHDISDLVRHARSLTALCFQLIDQQNTGEEAIRLEMLSVYNAHREALRIDAQRRLDEQHLMTELQEKRAKLDDTLFDTEDGKKQAKIERREIDDEVRFAFSLYISPMSALLHFFHVRRRPACR